MGNSPSAFFDLCERIEAVSETSPCAEHRRGGAGFPEASVAELWGFPVVAAGSNNLCVFVIENSSDL